MADVTDDLPMPMFTEIDPWRDEDFWPKFLEDEFAQPGEGATPGPNDCTPEKRGAGSSAAQRGRFPAPPSPCTCRKYARCLSCIERDGILA